MNVYYNVKQIKKNLQKYYHPFCSYHLTYCMCNVESQKSGRLGKKTTVFLSIFLLGYGVSPHPVGHTGTV